MTWISVFGASSPFGSGLRGRNVDDVGGCGRNLTDWGASDLTNYNGDADADVSAAKACFQMNWGSGGSLRIAIAIAAHHGTEQSAQSTEHSMQ